MVTEIRSVFSYPYEYNSRHFFYFFFFFPGRPGKEILHIPSDINMIKVLDRAMHVVMHPS